MKRLTPKERLFVHELLADEKMNPERAAIKVGYSPTVARNKAYVWVSNSQQNPKPQVKALLDEMLRKKENDLDITIERIMREWVKMGFANLVDIIEKMGGHINMKLLKTLSEAEKASIAEISETEVDGVITRKIKLHDKHRSLESLARRIKPIENSGITINVIKDGEIISTNKLNE